MRDFFRFKNGPFSQKAKNKKKKKHYLVRDSKRSSFITDFFAIEDFVNSCLQATWDTAMERGTIDTYGFYVTSYSLINGNQDLICCVKMWV